MIHVSTTIAASLHDVWSAWNNVSSIKDWAFPNDSWGAEGIENDVRVGGAFKARSFARDGSTGFVMEYVYDQVVPEKFLSYTMTDGRKVQVEFTETEGKTRIDQAFEPETENPEEVQHDGWQAYLDNFKKFVENSL